MMPQRSNPLRSQLPLSSGSFLGFFLNDIQKQGQSGRFFHFSSFFPEMAIHFFFFPPFFLFRRRSFVFNPTLRAFLILFFPNSIFSWRRCVSHCHLLSLSYSLNFYIFPIQFLLWISSRFSISNPCHWQLLPLPRSCLSFGKGKLALLFISPSLIFLLLPKSLRVAYYPFLEAAFLQFPDPSPIFP